MCTYQFDESDEDALDWNLFSFAALQLYTATYLISEPPARNGSR